MQKKGNAQKARGEVRDRTYGALEAFPEYFRQFRPPAGDFNPSGEWKQSWAVWLFSEVSGPVGFLEIRRRPVEGGAILTVATRLAHGNGYQEQTATLECAADPLGTLRSIELTSTSSDADGTPVGLAKAFLSGRVRGGAIEWTRGVRKQARAAPPPLVAHWALFDSVGRLEAGVKQPLEFTLLDDGDVIKPAQRLVCEGQVSFRPEGGAVLPLRCWEQTGYGVLPTHYWADGKGRLLFAVAGQKAYLWDPEAAQRPARRRRG